MKWLVRTSFSSKLYIGFSVVLSLTLLMSAIALIQISNIHSINRELGDNWMPSIDTLRNINDCFDRYLICELRHINEQKTERKAQIQFEIDSIIESIESNQEAFKKLIISEEGRRSFSKLDRAIKDFFTNVAEKTLQLSNESQKEEAMVFRRTKANVKRLENYRKYMSQLIQTNVKGGIKATGEGENIYQNALLTVGVILLAAIFLGGLVVYFVSRDILHQVGGEPRKIADITHRVSMGDLDIDFDPYKKSYGIYASVKNMVNTLKDVAHITAIISEGDTSKKLIVKSDKDILASSINSMIDNFKGQNHIKDGLNQLSKELSGNISLIDLCHKSISFIARFVEAAQGVVYLFNKEKEILLLYGTYAFKERDSLSNEYKIGEGLVGQVALEKKEILLKNVSRKEALISTGLIEETPFFLLALPLLYENKLCGVLELSSFLHFNEGKMDFLNESAKIIATYINSAEQNEEVKRLLAVSEEATRMAEAKTKEVIEANAQLAQQQEELRAQAEEIMLRNESLELAKEELAERSNELEIANKYKEEMNQNLEQKIIERTLEINQQKEEIEAQRDNLEDANQLLEVEMQKSDKLLLNILPEDIALELKIKGETTTRQYKLVSVLFTDFEGFTQIASKLSANELVTELNSAFDEFDRIIEKYHLEKIKTIGDAYMCAGGLPKPNLSNPIDTVLAGLEIQRVMQMRRAEKLYNNEEYWKVRLGINSGEVIAGVIGKKKFAFDIWGDTVNAASRMESNSEVGKVNISEITYQYVKDFFDCDFRGSMAIKGKGQMNMYFVTNIKPELSIDGLGIEPNDLFYTKLEEHSQEIEKTLV